VTVLGAAVAPVGAGTDPVTVLIRGLLLARLPHHTDAATGGSRPTTATPSAPPVELERLVRDHGEAAFRLAYSVVGNRPDAEDVAQEALLKAWLALPSFRGEGSLRSWVLRITHTSALAVVRARRQVPVDPVGLDGAPGSEGGEPPAAAERAAAVAAFRDALASLDPLSREIVVLREVEGLSYDEIVALLRVPLPTVKTRLLRARRVLGEQLEGWR
jgi:RNA polymerase sigma-70 factor (ECF subfamily)